MAPVRLFTTSSGILSLILLSACSAPEPLDNVVIAENPETFNYVTPLQRSASTPEIYDRAGYYIVFDDDAREANITISNLVVEDGAAPLTLTFDGVPMDFTPNQHNTQRIIRADVLISSDPVNAGTAITNVTIIHSKANDLDPYGYSGLFASYCVDNRYQVVSFPYHLFLDGTTRVNTSATSSIDYTPTYRISLNPTSMKAAFQVDGLKLGEGSTADFTIPEMSLSLSDSGFSAATSGALSIRIGDKPATVESLVLRTEQLNQLRYTMKINIDGIAHTIDGFLTAYHTHR